MNMTVVSEDTSHGAELLRDEITSIGSSIARQTPDRYLESAATSQIVGDLRRAQEGGITFSPTLAMLLRLDDQTLSFAVAALRDHPRNGKKSSPADGVNKAQDALAGALAESYLENHRMSVLLSAAIGHLSALLKRLEKNKVTLESDVAGRDALALIGTYNLWRAEPDNPTVISLLNELAERVKPAPSPTPPAGEKRTDS